jgi:hypothetical protein
LIVYIRNRRRRTWDRCFTNSDVFQADSKVFAF